MRNVPLDGIDHTPRAVLALGTDYPPDTLLDTHQHRRAQFLYGATGLMEVSTDDGAWVVPPNNGVWIPPNKPHQVRMLEVSTRSLYIEPADAPRAAERCEVLGVSALLRSLLLEAVDVPLLYAMGGRDGVLMRLLLHEVAAAPVLPLFAPLPRDPRLAALCKAFLQAPHLRTAPGDWAEQLHKSERTFNRLFRQQTGMSFGQWRQQACLLAAVARLCAGQSVTRIALELGYESPAAFSSLFRRRLGRPPSRFVRDDGP